MREDCVVINGFPSEMIWLKRNAWNSFLYIPDQLFYYEASNKNKNLKQMNKYRYGNEALL